MKELPLGVQILALILGVLVILRILYALGLFSWWKSEHSNKNETGKISFRRKYIAENQLEHYYHDLLTPFQFLRLTVLFAIVIIATIVLIKLGYDYFFSEFDSQELTVFFWDVSKWTSIILGVIFIYGSAKFIIPSLFLRDFSYLIKGNKAQGKENYLRALTYFEKAVNLFPSEYGYFKVGLMKKKLEEKRRREDNSKVVDFSEAIEAFTKSVEAKYPNYRAYVERSELALQIFEYDMAIADLEKASEMAPNFHFSPRLSKAYRERAIGNEVMGERDNAIEDYGIAISFAPYDADLFEERAKLKHWNQDFKGAIDDYIKVVLTSNYSTSLARERLKALFIVSSSYDNYSLLVKSLIERKKKNSAIQFINEFAESAARYGDIVTAIRIYQSSSDPDPEILKKYSTWEKKFEEGLDKVDIKDDSFASYRIKSKHFSDFGKLDEAFEILNSGFQYIKTRSEKLNYYLTLGDIHLKNWDYNQALDAYYQGWELDEDDQYLVFYQQMARIRANRCEFTEAYELFKKYISLRRQQELKIEDYMYVETIEVQKALRLYEEALAMIESVERYFPDRYELVKMLRIREQRLSKKIFDSYTS